MIYIVLLELLILLWRKIFTALFDLETAAIIKTLTCSTLTSGFSLVFCLSSLLTFQKFYTNYGCLMRLSGMEGLCILALLLLIG
jgi:hypothetical protein